MSPNATKKQPTTEISEYKSSNSNTRSASARRNSTKRAAGKTATSWTTRLRAEEEITQKKAGTIAA